MTDGEEVSVVDDDLRAFEANGAPALPVEMEQAYLDNAGARIWYASAGNGPVVVLLHGGLGHSGNWGHQVPALLDAGFRTVVIDSRGHGRSTRDERPYSYELMAADVLAVLDALGVQKAHIVGWSDGACTALSAACSAPERVASVFFFGCNVDPSGVKQFDFNPDSALGRCFSRHAKDYEALSPTPGDFSAFSAAVDEMMKTQPNYSAAELAAIRTPVTVAHSEHDEFIKREHAEYLARTIPNATFTGLPGVSHFAPLQRPALFNAAVLLFLTVNPA
jgi:pimeloyl-ACP methyl ester carboxylesterase